MESGRPLPNHMTLLSVPQFPHVCMGTVIVPWHILRVRWNDARNSSAQHLAPSRTQERIFKGVYTSSNFRHLTSLLWTPQNSST